MDVNAERKMLMHCMNQATRKVDVLADTATPQSLRAAAGSAACRVLHFSGLAHGPSMALEARGLGGPLWLDERGLKLLVHTPSGTPKPPLAIVTSRSAAHVGHGFVVAGFKHVVCCDKKEDDWLSAPGFDRVGRVFTYPLYSALVGGATVRTAFDQACKAVRTIPGAANVGVATRCFQLLPVDGDHDVAVFDDSTAQEPAFPPGVGAGGLRRTNKLHELLSPRVPTTFVGREVDLFRLLRLITSEGKRLVNVTGPESIGKSTLVHAACHFLNDRASATRSTGIERIFYFNLAPQFPPFVARLRDLLARERICSDAVAASVGIRSTPWDELFSLFHTVFETRALVVLDNADLWDTACEGLSLEVVIEALLEQTSRLRVVCTSESAVLSSSAVASSVYQLQKLRSSDALRLFISACPRATTELERQVLYHSLRSSLDRESDSVGGLARDFCEILNSGVPAKIIAEAGRYLGRPKAWTEAHTAYRNSLLAAGRADGGPETLNYELDPQIHPHDVLCGRDARANSHIGNISWRALVQDNKSLYLSLPMHQRWLLSQSIVMSIRSQNPPGKFLKKHGNSELWYDVGDKMAAELAARELEGVEAPTHENLTTASSGEALTLPRSASSMAEGRACPFLETGSSFGSMCLSDDA